MLTFVPDGLEGSHIVSLGVAGALSKEYSADQRAFLPMLAKLLKSSAPDQVQLIETGLFKKTLKGLVVEDGENRLTLEDPGRGPLQASFTRVVRGIALKTQTLSMEEWLAMLSDTLEHAASVNAESRAALAEMLGLN
jgi:hypothetical protein